MRWTRVTGMAALIATLAIVLALSLGLWGHLTASAQDTFIVNDDTTPTDGGCGTPDFETEDIQDAVDSGLVADGDTLVICEGTYNPPNEIEVTKDLTIEGRAAANRDNIVVQGIAGSSGFSTQTPGVTIRHLKLVGPGGAGVEAGIYVPSDDNLIEDVEITAWHTGILTASAEGTVVQTSSIHTNTNTGVAVRFGDENVIRNNEIKDNTVVGLDLDREDQTLVDGNTLSGNSAAQVQLANRSLVSIVRNQIDTTGTTSDGIFIPHTPAEALIEIGGSPENANTFTGPFGAPHYYVALDCAAENTVDATYNWWGSTNRNDIANRIFNDEDDASTECPAPDDVKGAVVFHPWATGPAPTPTPSATPTATGTPTATATGTPTPTATPGATRTVDLSPPGWHDLAWSGADATDPGTALACIAGKYSIAYAWEGPTAGFKRYVEGCAVPGICNMSDLNKYDTLLVNITAADVTCVMPVVP
jgi:parallel beta-helix repeat protein